MIQRLCNPSLINSFFLFGCRGVGKTTLLANMFHPEETLFVDLLDLETYDQILLDKSRFLAIITSRQNSEKRIIIDEIQKVPELLNVVHQQIQKHKRLFVLTGSSGRRLKQKGVNLLAGRAWVYHLFPFSSFELGTEFDLKTCLERGGLPDAYLSPSTDTAREYLSAYVGTYLQKEIQEESWVRNLAPFRKFLAIAAQMNGKIINKSQIANEIGVNDVTVANYFEILEDTHIGFFLPAYHTSVRKAQRMAPKFYFIDPGIKRALDKTLAVPLVPQTSGWGDAFEHWVILEFKKYIHYARLDWELSYIRTKDDVEIDIVIERPGNLKLLVEVKSKSHIKENDVKALETLGKDIDPNAERWLLSADPLEQQIGNTRCLHWQEGLKELFEDKLRKTYS